MAKPDILEMPAVADADSLLGSLDTTAIDDLTGPFRGLARFIEIFEDRDTTIGAATAIRIDVLGPISTALALRAAGMDLYEALAVGTEVAALTGERVLRALRRRFRTTRLAVVMDEPSLIGAMHPTFPLLSGDIGGALTTVVERIDDARPPGPLLIGIHVPGRTDWATVITSGVSLISTSTGGNLEGCAQHLQAFLDAGGIVAWGAVPVDEPLGGTDELLWRRISTFWCSLVAAGVDPFLLRSQSMMSTSDGLGHFDPDQLPQVIGLVTSLSTRVHRQAAGTRLSLGA